MKRKLSIYLMALVLGVSLFILSAVAMSPQDNDMETDGGGQPAVTTEGISFGPMREALEDTTPAPAKMSRTLVDDFVTYNLDTDSAAMDAGAVAVPLAAPLAEEIPPEIAQPTLRFGDDNPTAVKVVQQALIDLGYLTGEADGQFGGATETAVRRFQYGNGLGDDGVVGAGTWTMLTGGEAIAAADAPERPRVKMLDWFADGKKVFQRGDIAEVTDVASGVTFKIWIRSTGNHTDVEPLTAEDTKKILSFRGKFSWTRRAVIVTIDGQSYAGSANGMPHGRQDITDNNFKGHFCIHYLNSRTHGSNRVDADHQAQVKVAYNS